MRVAPSMLLTPEERAVVRALRSGPPGAAGEVRLPAQLDPAIHRLEQRGWVTLTSRGALLGDQREYGLSLTSEAKLALEDVASGGQSEEP
jgi:hypothetical protein